MSGLNKFIAGVVLGAAAGAAVALFLQTEKGKKVMNDVKDAAADASEKIKSKMKQFGDEVNDFLNEEDDASASAQKARKSFYYFYFEPIFNAMIELPLRRTLVRSNP